MGNSGDSQLPLVHSFHLARAIIERVKNGEAPFYSQYLLNPNMDAAADIQLVLVAFIGISALRLLLSGAHHPRWRNVASIFKYLFKHHTKPKRESKFCENFWYTCWHTFSFTFGLYVLYREALTSEAPGWTRLLVRERDVKWYWFPTPSETLLHGNQGWPVFPITPLMRTYYLTELAFWLSCIFFLWIETIRHDFHALLLHHVVTCVLILFSYVCSFWRVGAVILLTHNFADIVLYSAKSVYYTTCFPSLVDGLFVVFVVVFFASRLVFFPLFCLRPALDSSHWSTWTQGVISRHWDIPGGIGLPLFLCVLQILHIFWFGLIIKMVIRTVKDKLVSQQGDIRSDDELEDAPDESDQDVDDDDVLSDAEPSSARSSTSSDSVDQRMHMSSLPGVRAPARDSEEEEELSPERHRPIPSRHRDVKGKQGLRRRRNTPQGSS